MSPWAQVFDPQRGECRGTYRAIPAWDSRTTPNEYPHILSGGEQQRVALARAIAPRPSVLLMDEPFSGLDPRLRERMREETLAILHETRATCIVVTHDAEEAMRMGHRVALLRKGRVAHAGTALDLYRAPKTSSPRGPFQT